MAKFRILLILMAAWLIVLFNIERPDILKGGESIDLNSFVYVLAGGITVLLLMFPDLGKERFTLVATPFAVMYVILKIFFNRSASVDNMFVYIMITEIVTLGITLWVGRNVSVAVASFEDAVENAVLDTSKSRALNTAEGTDQINHELFRARRFNRPVAILYLRNSHLPGLSRTFSEQFDLEYAFRRRYLLHRIAQLVEALTYRSDIIAWHNDNLVICMPETTRENALVFAKQLHSMLQIRLNLDVKMGLAVFPQDALIIGDLIDVALQHSVHFDDNTVERAAEEDSTEDFEDDDGPPSGSGGAHDESEPDSSKTQELDPVGSPWAAVRMMLSGPQLFPLDGVPLLQTQTGTTSTDPQFWVNELPYQSASAREIYSYVKRLFDISAVLIVLPFALPVMLIIAILIRLSGPGPIFFRQQRTGRGGHRFAMYKFRTMVPNAEELLQDLAAQGLAKLDESGKLAEPLKLKRDPRVTRVGRILRKTSLDEMPQIWNVLKGDMSLVGPRPTSWNVDSYTLFQTERLSVRPGITGLWQVYSRGNTDFDNWLEWDMKYMEKMSLVLDLQILVRTVLKVFAGSGAR